MVGKFVGPWSGWRRPTRSIALTKAFATKAFATKAFAAKAFATTCIAMVVLPAAPSGAQVPAPSSHVAVNEPERHSIPIVTIDLDHTLLRNALDTIAREAGLSPVYGDAVSGATSRVSVHVHRAPVTVAFEQALRGTGLTTVILSNGYVKIVDQSTVAQETGSIHGTVTDASTKRPLAGATILLDSARTGVLSKSDGTFLIPTVTAGTHLVTARMLSYGKQTRRVVVVTSEARRVDFALEERVNALDRVVVTGTVAAVRERAISNAVTVITAKQLQDRNITHIDQLFRGDVPGIFAPEFGLAPKSILGGVGPAKYGAVTMYSRGSTVLPNSGVGGTDAPVYTKAIKTYVDGVVIADPDYLNQIDPKSIDHIEIITGPQASTLYGSDALGGVMQIFTKRGRAGQQRPEVTASLQYGMIQNNFSSGLAPQHNDNIQVTDVVGPLSYNLGGTYGYTGQWTPGSWDRTVSVFGGAQRKAGPLTVNLMARTSDETKGGGGGSLQQALQQAIADGEVAYTVSALLPQPNTNYDITGQTYGTTVNYAPFSWLTNQLTLGYDESAYSSVARGAQYVRPSDSLNVSRSANSTNAVSASFNTTAINDLGLGFHSTLTLGADLQHQHYETITEDGADISTFSDAYDTRTRDRTRGLFGQWLLGFRDAVYLTLGLRAEQSPDYGDGHSIDYAPRYGLSLVHDIGTITAKVRYTEGRSTRPPAKGEKDEITACTQNPGYYCDYYTGIYGPNLIAQAGAPNLRPESQRGPEYGIDLYFGNRGSLSITDYNQHVYNLIFPVTSDSIQAIDPVSNPYPFLQTQYQNVGDVKNSGLTFEGTLNQGPFTFSGTYSWTRSRITRLEPGYQGVDKVGDSFQSLAEHTGAFTATYTNALVLLSATVTMTGQILDPKSVNGQDAQFGTRTGSAYVARIIDYQPLTALPPSAMVSLNASRTINRNVTLFMNVENAGNYYRNEGNQGSVGTFPVMGRQTSLGARLRF